LIEKNYDLNRAAFYAYGEYLNYFRRNLLKRIFNSEQLDVANIARNFGFTTAPRVKEGKFLTVQARKEKKLAKASKPKKESAET
jgi:ATP-dependent RNA helicase DDX18/HAS1